MKDIQTFKPFWNWYERTYKAQLLVAVILFLVQAIHLIWLTVDVAIPKLTGTDILHLHRAAEFLISIVDYSEIPAIFSVSLIYINQIRKKIKTRKNIMMLAFLNSQWIHILWITDEFVVDIFNYPEQNLIAVTLALIAIGIDYLEIPVMIDATKQLISQFKSGASSKSSSVESST